MVVGCGARVCFESLSSSVIHCWAWVCRAMAKRLAAGDRSLYVSPSGGASSREISWAISASVLTWKEPVRLMTIGMMTMGSFQYPWSRMACFRGS